MRSLSVVGVVSLTGGAWAAGRRVASPAEAAARAKPPVPSRITAPAERRVLESTVVVRGIVRYGDPRPVLLPASAVKSTATAAPPIVSTPATKGKALGEGDVALVASGRPVLVLAGASPAYRDLRPGDRGADVQQLEAALTRLGFAPGSVDGLYDTATARAVDRWYEAAGFRSFGPTDAQRAQLRTARATLAQSDDAVLAAQRSVDELRAASTGDRLVAAREQVTAAKEKADSASSDATLTAARADGEVQARQDALDLAAGQVQLADDALAKARRDANDRTPIDDARAAVANAQSAVRSAGLALTDAEAQVPLAAAAVADAEADADAARRDLDTVKRTSPTTIAPDGVIVVLDNTERIRQAETAVRRADAALRQARAAVSAAERTCELRRQGVDDAARALETAQNGVARAEQAVGDRQTAVTEAEQRVQGAQADRARAERELTAAQLSRDAGARNGAASVRQAGATERIASAQLESATRPAGLATAEAQLRNARASRSRAEADLSELEAQTGIVVPANEVLFFPSLPVRVDEVKAQRGDPVTGAVMTVTTPRLAVDSSVDSADAKLVHEGAAVRIESDEFDVSLDGVVTQIASTAGTKGVDPGKVYLEVSPTGDAPESGDVGAADLDGASVKLSIPIRSSGGAVLAVPVAGVSVAADGTSRIEIEDDPEQPTRFVRVRTGVVAEGYVAVTPVQGTVRAGARVVVGNRDGSAIEGAAVSDVGGGS